MCIHHFNVAAGSKLAFYMNYYQVVLYLNSLFQFYFNFILTPLLSTERYCTASYFADAYADSQIIQNIT